MQQFLRNKIYRIRRLVRWVWQLEGTPGQRARGLAVGVFSGCFPLFGLQTLLGIAPASFVKGNHLLAALGTWVSNPITYWPLYWVNYQLGCLLLGRTSNWHALSEITYKELWIQSSFFLRCLFVGSTFVGLVSASVTGTIAYLFLKRSPLERRGSH